MWFPPRRSVLGRIAALEVRMSDISSDQAHLNTEVDALKAAVSAVEAEVAALKAQPTSTPLDFSGLDAAVQQLQGDVPSA